MHSKCSCHCIYIFSRVGGEKKRAQGRMISFIRRKYFILSSFEFEIFFKNVASKPMIAEPRWK